MKSERIKKILVLGATGMLGSTVFRFFANRPEYLVYGTVRNKRGVELFSPDFASNLILGVDVENFDSLTTVFEKVLPDVVINCIGIVKQLSESNEVLSSIPINAMLPHRLAKLCNLCGARLIHLSTDCVFNGSKGMYVEEDAPDAFDVYGRSKALGEVNYKNSMTLRTSIIGHEINSSRSLLNWFLSQEDSVKGYKNAIFSGLPTVEIAKIICEYVLPNESLHGLYHVSSDPISKYELLKLISLVYRKEIDIEEDWSVVIDRSLDSSKFRSEVGYEPPSWEVLVNKMKSFS